MFEEAVYQSCEPRDANIKLASSSFSSSLVYFSTNSVLVQVILEIKVTFIRIALTSIKLNKYQVLMDHWQIFTTSNV